MNKMYAELEKEIQNSYESGVTLEQAEKLAGKFLHAQILVANELADSDLDSRMKKQGTKAIKAAIYMEAAKAGEKKPTEAMLAAIVDQHEVVIGEQKAFDAAEVKRDKLQNYLNIFKESHVHFRTIARGRFE